MKTPTIHLNGTRRKGLCDAVMAARAAVMAAINALGATYPRGLDYYTQELGAINTAMAEHESRLNRLNSVMGELNDLATAIQDF